MENDFFEIQCSICKDDFSIKNKSKSLDVINKVVKIIPIDCEKINWTWILDSCDIDIESIKYIQEIIFKFISKHPIDQTIHITDNVDKNKLLYLKNTLGIGNKIIVQASDVLNNIETNIAEAEDVEIVLDINIEKEDIEKMYTLCKKHSSKSISLRTDFKSNTNENLLELYKKLNNIWINDTIDGVMINDFIWALDAIVGEDCFDCKRDCRGNVIHFDLKGNIYPCYNIACEKYCTGNILKIKDIDDLFNSSQNRLYSFEVQKRHMITCNDCNVFEFCKGGCNSTFMEDNSFSLENGQYCADVKNKISAFYNEFRKIDIYNGTVNSDLIEYLMTKNVFTVKEIQDMLKDKGVDYKYHYDENMFMSAIEFKLFLFFNNKNIRKRLDDISKKESYVYNFTSVRLNRTDLLSKTFDSGYKTIKKILEK